MPFAAKLNEFMFFSSVRVRSSSEPARADGDVDVEAHRALLELGVGQAELDDGLAQQLQEALGRLGVVQVGLGHDLDERRAAAVEVDERGGRAVQASGLGDVDVLRRILLEMRARDADRDAAVVARHDEPPARAERLVVLADLVRLRQVGIEVVLAVEDRPLGDLAVEREPELDRLLDRAPVRHGQRAGEGEADRADVRVRRVAVGVAAAAEHLRLRLQLHVDLEPDHRLPGVVALIGGAPGRCRSRARPRAHARRGRACSRRTAARSAAGRPAALPRARTGCSVPAAPPCTTGSSAGR